MSARWLFGAAGAVLILMVGLFMAGQAGAQQAGELSVDAPSNVAPGATTTVQVDVGQVTSLGSAQFDISFVSGVLSIGSISPGADITNGTVGGTTVPVVTTNQVGSGATTTVRVIMSVGGSGATGSGFMSEIVFTATSTTGVSSPISLTNIFLADTTGATIQSSFAGAVTLTVTTAPPTSTPVPPTSTPVPPTATPGPAVTGTATAVPTAVPTDTPVPAPPTTTPTPAPTPSVTPVPAAGEIQGYVIPQGAITLETEDKAASVAIPVGGVAEPIFMGLRQQSSAEVPGIPDRIDTSIGTVIEITIRDVTGEPITDLILNRPATISFPFTIEQLLDAGLDGLEIYRYDPAGAGWTAMPTTLDLRDHVASTRTSRFSSFALTLKSAVPPTPTPAPGAAAPTPTAVTPPVGGSAPSSGGLIAVMAGGYYAVRARAKGS